MQQVCCGITIIKDRTKLTKESHLNGCLISTLNFCYLWEGYHGEKGDKTIRGMERYMNISELTNICISKFMFDNMIK